MHASCTKTLLICSMCWEDWNKWWAGLDSNQEPSRYERRALPLSYRPVSIS